ncbi:MAG: copper chaperone PCu(A)C [Amaricoccus sp.]
MRVAVTAALLLAAVGLAAAAGAQEYRLGDLVIADVRAPATAARAQTAAGYLTVSNAGSAADRLVAVKADFPEVGLHVSETDAGGVSRMREVAGIEIPPGATVKLEPGGAHVMFMGLAAPFVAGESVAATLVFEKAGSVEVAFEVEARGAGGAAHDMPGMKMPGSGG